MDLKKKRKEKKRNNPTQPAAHKSFRPTRPKIPRPLSLLSPSHRQVGPTCRVLPLPPAAAPLLPPRRRRPPAPRRRLPGFPRRFPSPPPSCTSMRSAPRTNRLVPFPPSTTAPSAAAINGAGRHQPPPTASTPTGRATPDAAGSSQAAIATPSPGQLAPRVVRAPDP
jgi:hypothetical protein